MGLIDAIRFLKYGKKVRCDSMLPGNYIHFESSESQWCWYIYEYFAKHDMSCRIATVAYQNDPAFLKAMNDAYNDKNWELVD